MLLDELYADSWNPALGRFRSRFAYRGMGRAAAGLETSLVRRPRREPTGNAAFAGEFEA